MRYLSVFLVLLFITSVQAASASEPADNEIINFRKTIEVGGRIRTASAFRGGGVHVANFWHKNFAGEVNIDGFSVFLEGGESAFLTTLTSNGVLHGVIPINETTGIRLRTDLGIGTLFLLGTTHFGFSSGFGIGVLYHRASFNINIRGGGYPIDDTTVLTFGQVGVGVSAIIPRFRNNKEIENND